MSSIKFLLLLMPLVVISTQGFLIKNIDAEENVNTDGTYLENIKTIAQDIKDALSEKKQTVVDTVSAVGNKKHEIISNIKDSKKKLVENVLASQIAKVNAMKAAKEEFMKKMGQIQPFFFLQNKIHKIKEAVPTLPPVEDVKTRLSNFFLEFFDKFQGHFQKHNIFHKGSKDVPFPQIQGSAASVEHSEPQMNFFPFGSIPMEDTFSVTQTTDASPEYVKPVQPAYEFSQMEDVHPGFQPSQFAPSSNYDEPREDNFTPPEFSAVDFTDHQTNSGVRSPYYGSYQTSVNSAPATYRTQN